MTPTAAALHRLQAVLARENAALTTLDLTAIGALVAEKEAALAALSAAAPPGPAQGPTQGPALGPTLGPGLRAIAALAAENRRLLERALAVQAAVIALVARAAPAPPAAYRAPGQRPASARTIPRTLCARA